jgi:hypothetical protein
MKKVFQGFKVLGEKRTCGLCGYEFKESEEIEFLRDKSIFNDDGDSGKVCKNCEFYFILPMTQRCMFRNVEVTALDSCEDFKQK